MSQYTAKKLSRNIVFSVVQIFVSALVVFFLYRYAIRLIGISQFGVWSVVSTSITSLSILNYGFSGSMVKYIAKYQSLGETDRVKKLIETSVISVALFAVVLGTIGCAVFTAFVPVLIKDPADLLLAKYLIKICTLTFCVTVIASAFQSALEGLNHGSTKSIINCIASIALLLCSFVFIKRFGLVGLGYAYLTSALIGLMASTVALSLKLPALPLISYRWDKRVFRETLRYNYNFQVISLFSLLNDPVTKLILTKFGGTEYTGLYELASKLVLQVRNVLATANQTLVPMFANLRETAPHKIETYFKNSFFYVFVLSTFLFFTVIGFAPVFSLWWMGNVNYTFVFLLDVVTISWYLNSITMPAYFANLGSGNMTWNIRSHVGMGIANAVCSLLLGFFFRPLFICFGWFFSLSFFSLLIVFYYSKENNIRLKEIMPAKNWVYLLVTATLSVLLTLCFLPLPVANLPLCITAVLLYLSAHFYFFIYRLSDKNNRTQFVKIITG